MRRELATVELRGVGVDFGDVRALDDVSCTFSGAGVCGLIGTNGAGKTTLIHTVVGLRDVSRGAVEVHGDPDAIAYCPDTPSFDPYLTAVEVLEESALLGGRLPRRRTDAGALLAQVGLGDAARRQVGGFSRGMLQRLGVAAALGREPAVLILDEPTSALDPLGREALLRLIGELGERMLVVFSSHVLDDVSHVADQLVVLDGGRLLYAGDRAGFAGGGPRESVRLTLSEGGEALARALDATGQPWHRTATTGEVVFDARALPEVLEVLRSHPAGLVELSRRDSLLDEFVAHLDQLERRVA